MAQKPKRERTRRREATRQAEQVARDRERLFAREPGGAATHPLEVDSASVVELRARATPCPRCGGEHEVKEHLAVVVNGARLRDVHLRCQACGSRRSLWFRLPVLN